MTSEASQSGHKGLQLSQRLTFPAALSQSRREGNALLQSRGFNNSPGACPEYKWAQGGSWRVLGGEQQATGGRRRAVGGGGDLGRARPPVAGLCSADSAWVEFKRGGE